MSLQDFKLMIPRESHLERIRNSLDQYPIVALIGPRQCGKTTLARQLLPADSDCYFDLENPADLGLLENPMTILGSKKGLVVIDEAQREPEVFPVLRVLADRDENPAKFLILGSASPDLLRQASESLAGRVDIIELSGFSLEEFGSDNLETLWLRGGFPRSTLAESNEASTRWRLNFIQTFLERDLANLGFNFTPPIMLRFWTMLSHYHGQVWNSSEIANAMGIAPNTARRYLDVLSQTFMIRQLQPWHANVGKRQVKSPKIYLRDSGLFHRLQGIDRMTSLQSNPKLGASWEGFALEETLRVFQPDQAFFWAVHSGSELDLLMFTQGRKIGVEFKYQDAPKASRSMRIALRDLELDRLVIVYPGNREYQLDETISILPLKALFECEI